MDILTPLQAKEVRELLSQFGLHDSEQTVYLALLPLSDTTLTPLARTVQLPATTVQSILHRLADRGLVLTTKRKSRHVYRTANPRALKQMLERQLKDVATVLPLLEKLMSDTRHETHIRVYYRERMTDIFLSALESKNKQLYEIVAAKDIQNILGEKFHFTKRRVEKGIRLKSLRVESREIKKYSAATHRRELRETKFLPRELTFRASFLCWDNTVAFFTSKEEGLAWVVESRSLRETIMQLFELLWSVGRKMETAVE